MTSKTISITEDVYNELVKIKGEKESFSELFMRLLNLQKHNLKQSFGAWNLTEQEKVEIWNDLNNRPGRRWRRIETGEIE